jgi:hypothetical protein
MRPALRHAGHPCPEASASGSASSRTPRTPSAAISGRAIGNGRYSDITIFSFHPVKIITTAEGGMALTNNAELADGPW